MSPRRACLAFAALLLAACADPSASATPPPRPPPPPSRAPDAPASAPATPPASAAEAAPAPAPAPAPTPPIHHPHYSALLSPDYLPQGSTSTGDGVHGRLYNAAELPLDAPHLAVLPPCRERETHFANERLLTLLRDTADTLAKQDPEGPRLMICNMSRRRGGNIPWSRSHNSGLDVDVAFYVTHQGKPVDAPRLMHFNRDLVHPAEPEYAFDVPRNWAFVRALLTHPTVQVQWIFVSRRLRRALMEHAVSLHEPLELLFKAELTLWQPADSTPHKDHFHVRIYCPDDDRAEGCADTGPVWPWVRRDLTHLLDRGRALAPAFTDPDRATREAALDLLKRLRAPSAAPALAYMAAADPHPPLRLAATDLLLDWPDAHDPAALALADLIQAPGAGLAQDDDAFTRADLTPLPQREPAHLRRAWDLLERLGAPASAPFLATALTSRRTIQPLQDGAEPTPERKLAADAASGLTTLQIVPHLIDALNTADERNRGALVRALARVTNHNHGAHPERWRAWWDEHKHLTRHDLLALGFRRLPARLNLKDWDSVERLIRATERPDELGHNADRLASALTGVWSPPGLSPAKRHARWTAWWDQNGARLRQGMTTAEAQDKMGECSHQTKGCEYSRLGHPLPEELREAALKAQKNKKARDNDE